MRIIIDLEWIQCSAGNFSAELAPIKTLVQTGAVQELVAIVAGREAAPLRKELEHYLPRKKILSWPAMDLSENPDASDLNRTLKEVFIKSLRPDALIIPVPEIQASASPSPLTASFLETIPTFLIGAPEKGNMGGILYPMIEWLPPAEWRSLIVEKVAASTSQKNQDGTSLSQTIALLVGEFVGDAALDDSRRPRLAYVSPLPPLKSGIADYSESLIPHLARYYQIDAFVPQEDIAPGWVKNNCEVYPLSALYRRAGDYERVLYHFGNNPQHADMFELLEAVPGVVVLHDFFLSGINWYREAHQIVDHALNQALYRTHG